MTPLLKKLNFKNHKDFFVINSPEEFNAQKLEIKEYVDIIDESQINEISFILVFVENCAEIEFWADKINPHLIDDANLWFAYLKKSSKKYKSDISRDNGWQVLGDYGYEPVRQVAIDDDWSALRFRRAENIKTMTRNPSMAMSKSGKERLKK